MTAAPVPAMLPGVSARSRVEAALDRTLDRSPTELRRIFTALDPARIRAAADAVDNRRTTERLPLAGLTISIKDLFDEAGEVTQAGSVMLRDAPPAAADAPAVARLKAAGAVPFGRTTMTEFAYSGVGLNPHYGTCGNAFDPYRIPGGSTSGGGVGVALGLTDAALGSDTGGSVRIPAAFNALAGFKPSQRTVPLDGAFPLAGSFDSIGPLARDIETCAALYAALSGTQGRVDREAGVRGLTFGIPDPQMTDGMDAKVAADFERALGRLAKAGATIKSLPIPALTDAPPSNRTIGATEAYAVHRNHLDRLKEEGDPRVYARVMVSESLTDKDRADAYAIRETVRAAYAAAIATVDAILAPTVLIVPPLLIDVAQDFDRLNPLILRNPSSLNSADACAATVPMHAAGGLPTGLTVAGANGADWPCLDLAARVALIVGRPA